MIFSEIYSSYFNVVAAVLAEASSSTLTGSELERIVNEKAFSESVLSIPAALKDRWPLIDAQFRTPIRHVPEMPLTLIQKRWLKTLLQDSRIRLFSPDESGLEDIEPLFNMSDIVWFDKYLDGDPFDSELYITNFRLLLDAMKSHRKTKIIYVGGKGKRHIVTCIPYMMEFSEKEDKFRILTMKRRVKFTINIARIVDCELLSEYEPSDFSLPASKLNSISFELYDERKALDRILLHFSHFEKETEKTGERKYKVTLKYEQDDETELLIRILSFGPMIHVISPDNFIQLVRSRLQMQEELRILK